MNKTLLIAALLFWIAGTAPAEVTKYTDEAAYRAALTTGGYSTFSEGFENDAVWGSVRSSVLGTNSAPNISSMGVIWTSNHTATNDITTGSGAAKTGNWGIFDPDHGVATGTLAQCEVDMPPPECFFHDGITGSGEPGTGTLHGVGGWIRTNTPFARINVILDGATTVEFENIQLGTTFLFFGLIDSNGFNSFEIRETEGAVGDEKFIFADDFTFGKLTGANPDITNPIPGSALTDSTVTFQWTANGAAVTEWWLYIGTSPGAKDIYNSGSLGTATSDTVSGLPDNGSLIYLRLWFMIDGDWQNDDFQYTALNTVGRAEIIGTWDNGIWYQDVDTAIRTQMTADVTIGDIAAGDFTGDGKADVASSWVNGLWYQDGATLIWTKVSGSVPVSLTAGDVTGDGRSEIIGTWDTGIWYWDVAESSWTQMTSSVTDGDIAAGDFSGDGKADVASIWPNGLWYQDGDTLAWTKIPGSAPDKVTAGDVTGDGRSEIIGTWRSGIWYWDVADSIWTQMTASFTDGDIAAGDFTGDGTADVASSWASGLWYQDGATLTWSKIDNLPPMRVTAGNITGQ